MSEERDRLGYYQRNPPTPEWAARISAMYDSAVARAEAAEARVKELKADGHATGCDGESADDCACGFKRRSLLAENAALRAEVKRLKADHDAAVEEAADELNASIKAALMDEMHEHALTLDESRRVADEATRQERERLSADLRLAMSYYICDNMLGLDYHGSDEDFARKPGGKVNAEMERWKRTLGVGELHRKHPKHDHCTFCNAQWPCEFADEVKP